MALVRGCERGGWEFPNISIDFVLNNSKRCKHISKDQPEEHIYNIKRNGDL